MPPVKPTCKFCKGEVKYGNLFCCVECVKADEKKQAFHHDQLLANGFEQDKDIPNVYRKGGLAVTLERTVHVGLDKALQQHGHAVAQAEPPASEATR